MSLGVRLIFTIVLLGLGGCTWTAGDTAERIIGEWEGTVGGFPLSVVYTETTVAVGSGAPVAYILSGDALRFEGASDQIRLVSFPSRTEMVQTDPLTGSVHRYTRVP